MRKFLVKTTSYTKITINLPIAVILLDNIKTPIPYEKVCIPIFDFSMCLRF